MSDAANWILAGSLLVSIIAIFISAIANRKANAMQRRIVEIEEQREKDRQEQKHSAKLYPALRKSGSGKSERLYIVNRGDAEAKNIRVLMDGRPLEEHRASVQNDKLPEFVGPHSEISCLLATSFDCAPPFEVEVIWDDDSGTQRKYRTTLTF